MTLIEMKKKVLKMIEEISTDKTKLTDDIDIENKINEVTNQVMFELCRIKKIPAYEKMEVKKNQELELQNDLDNFYQLETIKDIKYDIFRNLVIFNEDGEAKILYYKYPKRITENNADKYKFELTDDVLEIMPYGIAADLLKSDVSSNYGQVYANRYTELKQGLDPRYEIGSICIEGGIDV